MDMKDEGRLVTVDINGLRYPIRSTLDAAYVADLAVYVEQKMQLASRESPAGDTLKIAVLAALNIADECFRARRGGGLAPQRPDPARPRARAHARSGPRLPDPADRRPGRGGRFGACPDRRFILDPSVD